MDIKYNLCIFPLKTWNQTLLITATFFVMTVSVWTTVLPLPENCNFQEGKGRTHEEYQVKFPKIIWEYIAEENIYIRYIQIYTYKSFCYSGIHTPLSQIIIPKPTQTKKLKKSKRAVSSFFLYLFWLIYGICCVHKSVHFNSASEKQHRLKKTKKPFHPTRSKVRLLGPPSCFWLRPVAHRLEVD